MNLVGYISIPVHKKSVCHNYTIRNFDSYIRLLICCTRRKFSNGSGKLMQVENVQRESDQAFLDH